MQAVQTYREGLAACPGSQELHAAVRLTAEQLPPPWLARYWALAVQAAQAPHPLSRRDGLVMRLVPAERRLPPDQLVASLLGALEAGLVPAAEARDLMCGAWAEARGPSRAASALMRAAAYLQAGQVDQACRDVKFALVYGPQRTTAPASGSSGAGAGGSTAGASSGSGAGAASAWPAGLALQAAALEAAGDNVGAALSAARALELEPGTSCLHAFWLGCRILSCHTSALSLQGCVLPPIIHWAWHGPLGSTWVDHPLTGLQTN